MIEKRMTMENKKLYDAMILKHVIKESEHHQTIAIYHSFKDEINTHPMIEKLISLNKTVCCPKITKGVMSFIKVRSLDDFEKGYFDIMEPKSDEVIDKNDIDCIFVPLLWINDAFYRIGYGGGYYDRYLKDSPSKKIGLAYSFQKTDIQFQEVHDVKLDALMTQEGLEA